MDASFCSEKLGQLTEVVKSQPAFSLCVIVLDLLISPLTILGNALILCVLWKTSSIPDNMKRLFLSLTLSDFAVGVLIQPASAVIITAALSKVKNESNNLDIFCPHLLTAKMYALYFLVAASFFTTAAIALDRLFSVFLHLRYNQLVTEKRVRVGVVLIWFTSGLATLAYMILPKNNEIVAVACQTTGIFVMAIAYIRLFKIVQYHKNQIRCQTQAGNCETLNAAREKKSTLNAFYVFLLFLLCYLPHLISRVILAIFKVQSSTVTAYYATGTLVIFNSSLNPVIYYWRYREIRSLVKLTVKHFFCMNDRA